ncbi:hypothetical protein [Pandoraea pulmonicola]|uniref:Uncharacterized protein n=1 Tax=Pandoraea pulmonicola TaxID=93221 RepID=A0AAJ4ZCC4_PANPU|nr:hypothetical protein [Pandoraea pulmonicola]APD13298.1 hypothetical protein RO07_25160 [Pandoraea pulmonicola]SUA90656.1 Uncharacterised protein [Pandoraea pulmonicola]
MNTTPSTAPVRAIAAHRSASLFNRLFRSRRPICLAAALALPLVTVGCAALGDWQVFSPAPYTRPAPVVVGPAVPVAPVAPAPAIVGPATPLPPVPVAPAVLGPAVPVAPVAPVAPVRPAPVIVTPAPPLVVAPPLHRRRDTRGPDHFLTQECYLRRGGCYTTESGYVPEYRFNPYTGTWDWVEKWEYRYRRKR